MKVKIVKGKRKPRNPGGLRAIIATRPQEEIPSIRPRPEDGRGTRFGNMALQRQELSCLKRYLGYRNHARRLLERRNYMCHKVELILSDINVLKRKAEELSELVYEDLVRIRKEL